MLPGASGLRWMPRKIAGIAMITIDPSIVAISIVSVVFDSATHLYRSDTWPARSGSDITPTGTEFTGRRLLASNYLPAGAVLPAEMRHSPASITTTHP